MAKTYAILVVAVLLSGAPVWAQGPSGGDTPGSASSRTPPPVTGEQVYQQVCQACHMADAKGGTGAATIPALAKNPRLAEPGYPIGMIAQGRGAMPPLTDLLNPAQIAAVVTYIRTHFGNSYKKPVTEADVRLMIAP
ncbi:MAG TPA: cytochrome c [Rhizomicrobium sp.]|jgi:mono/diheme cytochrome c family protein|nr:cytochrome c [Rhizomicrobium sp.]